MRVDTTVEPHFDSRSKTPYVFERCLSSNSLRKLAGYPEKAALLIVLALLTWSSVSHSEPGMDILELHSVKAVATTGTLDDDEIADITDVFKAFTVVSLLNPPTTISGATKSSIMTVAQTIAQLDSTARGVALCEYVPADEVAECLLNATLFSDAIEAVDRVVGLYDTLNSTDDLVVYAGSQKVMDTIVFTGRENYWTCRTCVGRKIHFANKKGLDLSLYEWDDNILDSEPDEIAIFNFRNMEEQSRTELRLASPITGAVYILTFSIHKDKGRWAYMYEPDRTRAELLEPSELTVIYDWSEYNVNLINSDRGSKFRGSGFGGPSGITSNSTAYDPWGWDALDTRNETFSLKYAVTPKPGYIPMNPERTEGCRWLPASRAPATGATREWWGFASQDCTITLKAQKDSDLDGIADEFDLCPDTDPDNPTYDRNGCTSDQRDTDEDGVTDDIDQCVETPAKVQVSTLGCADRDGDNTPDSDDAFPDDRNEDTDTDGDGVGDNADDFPGAVSQLSQMHGDDQDVRVIVLPRVRTSTCSLKSVEIEPLKAPSSMSSYAFQVGFDLEGCATGETVDVSIDFGKNWPTGARAHKVKGGKIGRAIRKASTRGTVVTYAVTDNGPLDTNPADGAISDPVTMAVTRPVPTVQLWHLIFLGAFLTLLARRKLQIT